MPDSASNLKIALAHGTFSFSFAIRLHIRPRTTRAPLSILPRLRCRILRITRRARNIRPQILQPGRHRRLCTLLARPARLKGPPNSRTPLRICMRPHSQAHAMIGDSVPCWLVYVTSVVARATCRGVVRTMA